MLAAKLFVYKNKNDLIQNNVQIRCHRPLINIKNYLHSYQMQYLP